MKNGKLTPFFSYEKKETFDEKEADKIMQKIIKNALSKVYKNI